MGTFLSILSLINTLLPLIHETVIAVEKMFPEGGQGAVKLQMVDDLVQGAAKASGLATEHLGTLSAILGPIVSGIVGISNTTGRFFNSGSTATTAQVQAAVDAAPVAAAVVDLKG